MVGMILLLVGILLSGSALAAFCWAARDGQFSNLDIAPRIIFDDDESASERADCFPDKRARTMRDQHFK